MATYREIHGKAVKSLDTDPSASTDAGQIWYNTVSNTFKSIINLEAWVSASNMVESRQNTEGAGTQTAGLAINGATGPGTPTFLGNSSEYNGTGWAAPVSTNVTAISKATFGTQTAAAAAGGYSTSDTTINTAEEYNGTAWTAVTAMPQATRSAMGMGGQTSGLVAGGEDSTVLTNTQEYDGTNWTAGGAIPTGTYNAAANGTSESNSWFAGGADSFKNTSFLYNGSAWTAGENLNTARDQAGGAGIQTAALAFGGRVPPNTVSNVTESFDGSSWTTSPATLGTAAKQAAAFGTNTAAVFAGNDPASAITQEFNSTANIITAAAWSSLNGPPAAVYGGGTGGTPTAAFLVAGYGSAPAPSANKTTYQLFDGSSWTEGPDVNTGRVYLGAAGTQTASLAFGGRIVSGTSYNALSEEYDGSSWTEGPNLNTARQFGGAAGTQTAALATCGNPAQTTNEEYDGSNWTAVNAYPTPAANQLRTTGTQTAAYCVGGASYSTVTASYDGTNWTAGPTMVIGVMEGNLNGTTSSAIHAGGAAGSSGYTALSQIYNSSVWYTGPNLGAGRAALPSGPSSTTSIVGSIVFGGPIGGPTYVSDQVEEYNAETTAINVKTLTQS